MNKLKSMYERIKKIKHIQIYCAVLVGLLICVVYFASVYKPKSDNTDKNSTEEYSSTMEYVDYLENKLGNVLSKISGVGNVDVIITLECGFTFEYATETETKTMTSGETQTTVTTSTVILVSNEPVIIKENYPVIKGVVVVAKGAENVNVKLNILTAVETVLEVDRNNITILA